MFTQTDISCHAHCGIPTVTIMRGKKSALCQIVKILRDSCNQEDVTVVEIVNVRSGVTMFVSIHRVSARFSSTDSGCHNLTLEEVRAIQVRFALYWIRINRSNCKIKSYSRRSSRTSRSRCPRASRRRWNSSRASPASRMTSPDFRFAGIPL